MASVLADFQEFLWLVYGPWISFVLAATIAASVAMAVVRLGLVIFKLRERR